MTAWHLLNVFALALNTWVAALCFERGERTWGWLNLVFALSNFGVIALLVVVA